MTKFVHVQAEKLETMYRILSVAAAKEPEHQTAFLQACMRSAFAHASPDPASTPQQAGMGVPEVQLVRICLVGRPLCSCARQLSPQIDTVHSPQSGVTLYHAAVGSHSTKHHHGTSLTGNGSLLKASSGPPNQSPPVNRDSGRIYILCRPD
jgi:hypothetical protein